MGKEMPVGVKIVSGLIMLCALYFIFGGASFLMANSIPASYGQYFYAILTLVCGVVLIILTLFLWKRKNWARIALGWLSLMLVIILLYGAYFYSSLMRYTLFDLFLTLIILAILLIIFGISSWYLLRKSVREQFN